METKYTDAEGQLGVGKNTSQAAEARRAGKDHRYLPGHERTLVTFDAWRLVAHQCVLRFRSWLAEPRVTAIMMADAIGLKDNNEARMSGSLNEISQRGMWAMSGYPVVRPTHRAAAAWMATNFGNLSLEENISPWPCFVVQVPSGLLWISAEDGSQQEVVVLSASYFKGKWAYVYSTNPFTTNAAGERDGLSIWGYGIETSIMAGERLPDSPHEWCDARRTSDDDRAERLARRLILGVCMYFHDKERVRAGGRVSKGASRKVRGSQALPDYKTWEMTSSVSIDVVRAVKEWSKTGEGKSPHVQCLVAGHGKWQPYGPRGSLRKWIHVEPYWRGPEDAPVADRSGAKT